jgi:hypothetical protein
MEDGRERRRVGAVDAKARTGGGGIAGKGMAGCAFLSNFTALGTCGHGILFLY